MPRRNDSPAIAASWAARATLTSGTAAPAQMRAPSSTAMSLNPRPSRTATPGTPPSRTMRLEPRLMTMTGISGGSCARTYDRSCSSSGMNNTCAGPPTRNHVSSANCWLAMSRPRRSGRRERRSGRMSGNTTVWFISKDVNFSRAPRLHPPSAWSRRRTQRRQLARQRVGPLGDAAGAEAGDVVAGAGDVLHQAGELLRAVEPKHMAMPARPNAGDQAVAVGTRNGGLAGRIDMGNDDAVGVVKAGAERLEQRMQAGVAVRLHHGDHLALGGFAGSAEHRCDFDRVVAVIVDHRDAVPGAGAGETPPHPAEARNRLADQRIGDAEIMRDCDGGGGVEGIVATGHRQDQILDRMHIVAGAVAEHHRKTRTAIRMIEPGQAHVGLRVFPICDDAAILDAADHGLHHRMIGAHHGEAVEWNVFDEPLKRRLHGIEGFEVVEV